MNILPSHLDSEVTVTKDPTLNELFSENIIAKIWRVATRGLEKGNPPTTFPEYVPQSGSQKGTYIFREASFWTCGFFPGTIYALLERIQKYPHSFSWSISHPATKPNLQFLSENLLSLGKTWSAPLHAMATRTDTHDLGFIILPSLRRDYEMTNKPLALTTILLAAQSLATRYSPTTKAIRSWDRLDKFDLQILSPTTNFLVIIDSICNLDLLFYASAKSGDHSLAQIATTHAKTLLTTHLRPESHPPIATTHAKTLLTTHLRPESHPPVSPTAYTGPTFSTTHVTNLCPQTGSIKSHHTAQGHATSSTWARGQAWAILGFTQTYGWTRDREFLDVACGLAEYFLYRLSIQKNNGSKVPLWDFDPPVEDPECPVQDSSAGAIAGYGMLLLSQILTSRSQDVLGRRYRDAALDILRDLLKFALADEKACFIFPSSGVGGDGKSLGMEVRDLEEGNTFDAILKNATANYNAGAKRRYWNHGLVYADYYLVLCGNEILKMGLV
ncbi:hypothetical protein HYFRA_00006914 [Hymenoscyphus fraxineus]|uniref:Glycoside hydrolase family 88 protein n=1 Tax=Hymenoscyphus fraxineus TaxID=746836 RepID=A0A9N9PNW5_9HELO|nr:hypothetical protein HYFRA_00006914 [Hymenoscyphus fraxineus]